MCVCVCVCARFCVCVCVCVCVCLRVFGGHVKQVQVWRGSRVAAFSLYVSSCQKSGGSLGPRLLSDEITVSAHKQLERPQEC